jgi:hypothetical protein
MSAYADVAAVVGDPIRLNAPRKGALLDACRAWAYSWA